MSALDGALACVTAVENIPDLTAAADTIQFPMLITEMLKWMSWRTIEIANMDTKYVLTGSLSVFGEFDFEGMLNIVCFAIVALLFLVVGIPFIMFRQMREAHRNGLLHTAAVKNRLGWLFQRYVCHLS